MNEFKLKTVKTKDEWRIYHSIRHKELFNNSPNYDSNHPDELKPENLPMLLWMDDEPVATVRLDDMGSHIMVIRLVAVRADLQGKGVGKALMDLIIEHARNAGMNKILVNARVTAMGYYEKFGFVEESWDPSDLYGIAKNSIQMSLSL